MGNEQVAAIRSFNRAVTERIGALHDEYLSRARPLGASRVLWEIGDSGTDVRSLRSRLNLDSGYLSRLLRTLEAQGLVDVVPDRADSRVRAVRLTNEGSVERALLETESDALALSLLSPLSSPQRSELVQAVSTVERLFTAGLVQVAIEDPGSEAAQFCIGEYFVELDQRFEAGFDQSISISADVEELTEPDGLFLIARLRGDPLGCGALKFHGDEPAEIKRMWVANSARGLGLGRRLLCELEGNALERGVKAVRLETNKSLSEAIGLYRSAGYAEVDAFNTEPFAHHWFEKHLELSSGLG